MQTQPSSYRARLKSIGFMGLVISPAVILVSVDPRWDGVLFLAMYTGLSAWVVQILNSDKQNK